MRDGEHPHPDLLLRFFRGETTKTETRAVVRHLLAGCRECLKVTRPLWSLSRRPRRTAAPTAIARVSRRVHHEL
jgi:hypothetical protein